MEFRVKIVPLTLTIVICHVMIKKKKELMKFRKLQHRILYFTCMGNVKFILQLKQIMFLSNKNISVLHIIYIYSGQPYQDLLGLDSNLKHMEHTCSICRKLKNCLPCVYVLLLNVMLFARLCLELPLNLKYKHSLRSSRKYNKR